MSRALTFLDDAALVGHAGKCQLAFLLVEMTLDLSDHSTHGVNQWIGVNVVPQLSHHLVKQLQRGQKDPQATPCAGGERNIFPAIPVLLHFTLQFLDQVIFDCLPYTCWRVIPTEPCANLP